MEKGSHYNLCISDLLMGLLFIFILILLKFMLDYQNKKQNLSKPLVERNHIIENIAKELEKKGVKVEVDKENGVLRLTDIHYFDEGQYELSKKGIEDFQIIQKSLFENIICYSHLQSSGTKQKWPIHPTEPKLNERIDHCKEKQPDQYGLIDSILIEGHADSKPIPQNGNLWKKGIKTNLDLAMKRSIIAFKSLTNYNEFTSQREESGNHLHALENKQEKPLFGVASYGNLRRSQNHNSAQLKKVQAGDRRIDIRFIMIQTEDVKEVVSQISKDISQQEDVQL